MPGSQGGLKVETWRPERQVWAADLGLETRRSPRGPQRKKSPQRHQKKTVHKTAARADTSLALFYLDTI